MNTHDKLVKYIRRGLQKGFDINFLQESLIKHGYSKKDVHKAVSHATGGPARENSRQRLKVLLGSLTIISIIIVISLILSNTNQQKQIDILEDQVELTSQAAEHYLSQLDKINEEIEYKDSAVAKQILQLKSQDQPKQVQELVKELEELHASIQKERKQTRDLLWDLLQTIIERGSEEEHGSNDDIYYSDAQTTSVTYE